MRAIGTPLKGWDARISRGVTTGRNDAFIIDDVTRQRLIAEDPKSAEILKPILRGRDIQRYQAQWAGLWLIATFPSLHLDIEDYPAIKEYLLFFGRDRLEQSGETLPDGGKSRKRTPHSWFELQDSTAYHREFAKEKLVWIDLTDRGRFAYDDSGIYSEATSFILSGADIKYLCTLLYSSLICWYLRQIAPTSGMGTLRWKKVYVETIPIPKIPAPEQEPFIGMADRILAARRGDPNADTADLETEIDHLVYKLCGLTDEEIAKVEQ